MAFEKSITEHDLDATSREFVQSFRPPETAHRDPDLAIDGLTESLIARIIRLFSVGKS